ncbi:hypothetical protein L6164_032637 [Bauhinia variegata]|uniref:Uncharacterized protein n=1 Tax=Bauhinia variegata TaxID=167791 RepID=A0ACB9KPE5_BAUVA|nr:hypothetical protein L6164_032637 [Bauhinia variegata]
MMMIILMERCRCGSSGKRPEKSIGVEHGCSFSLYSTLHDCSIQFSMASPSSFALSRDPFGSKSLALSSNSSTELQGATLRASRIFGCKLKSERTEQTHLRLFTVSRSRQGLPLKASRDHASMIQELGNNKLENVTKAEDACDLFDDLKDRFLNFKKNKYMENVEHFQNLANAQAPKFMVIACADSRVCPSNILGFQPGEAFMIRNVANLVPPFENGPSETNAALEFAVNTLKVENLLVIGHSCCGGIRALMGMPDDESASFIKSWVIVGKNARTKTKAAASSLNFDQQCKHCEKESVNHSLLNLLTYPWIEEKVAKGELSIHGGYYDFTQCTFEKWSLNYSETKKNGNGTFVAKDKMFWC